MNEYLIEVMKNLMSIFEKAPNGFCNSDNGEILTHDDVRLRRLFKTKGIQDVSNRELVFRKFYELRSYTSAEQIKRIPSQMIFLLKYGLNQDDVARILEDLVSEINNYNKFPGRIVFNPFS